MPWTKWNLSDRIQQHLTLRQLPLQNDKRNIANLKNAVLAFIYLGEVVRHFLPLSLCFSYRHAILKGAPEMSQRAPADGVLRVPACRGAPLPSPSPECHFGDDKFDRRAFCAFSNGLTVLQSSQRLTPSLPGASPGRTVPVTESGDARKNSV